MVIALEYRAVMVPRLLVIDEIGYLPFGREEVNLFFQRHRRFQDSYRLKLKRKSGIRQDLRPINPTSGGITFQSAKVAQARSVFSRR